MPGNCSSHSISAVPFFFIWLARDCFGEFISCRFCDAIMYNLNHSFLLIYMSLTDFPANERALILPHWGSCCWLERYEDASWGSSTHNSFIHSLSVYFFTYFIIVHFEKQDGDWKLDLGGVCGYDDHFNIEAFSFLPSPMRSTSPWKKNVHHGFRKPWA